MRRARRKASSWHGLHGGSKATRPIKTRVRPIEPWISRLIAEIPMRRELFESAPFARALRFLQTLPARDMKRRRIRLVNLLTGYAGPMAEQEFLRNARRPFKTRAQRAAKLVRQAADILGHDSQILRGYLQRNLCSVSEILGLEASGNAGAALYTVSKAFEAAAVKPEGDVLKIAGMDADNVAKRGVKKSDSKKVINGFLSREVTACLDSVPEAQRWNLASELLSLAGNPIDKKVLRAYAKRGH